MRHARPSSSRHSATLAVSQHREELDRVRRHWRQVSLSLVAVAIAVLAGAGVVLSQAQLGSASAFPGASLTRALGLLLVLIAGVCFGAARVALDRGDAGSLTIDTRAVWLSVPPLAVFLLTAPGFIGWQWAIAIAELPAIGQALVRAPGFTLAGASAAALGYSIALLARPRVAVEDIIEGYERLKAVQKRR